MKRILLAVTALVGACGSDVHPATSAERLTYVTRRGTLVAADTTRVAVRGRYVEYRVRLASSTGLALSGRLLVPTGGTPPFAAVLLNDGRELNSHAVDALPRDFGDVVALSLDYPEALPYDVQVGTLLRRQGELRDLARRIPSAFSLGGAYLARRADVDSARVAIVATSFAVPFAVIAASLDSTFREVALIYGAGDFAGVLAANLTLRPAWLRTPAAQIAMHAFAEFEPARYVTAIAPRRLLMVNGIDDPQMPASAVQSLYEAAGEPKSLVWLRTGHLMPDDSTLIRVLVDTTLARLPVLHTRSSRHGVRTAREKVGNAPVERRELRIVGLGDLHPQRLGEADDEVEEVHRVEVDLVAQVRVGLQRSGVDFGCDLMQCTKDGGANVRIAQGHGGHRRSGVCSRRSTAARKSAPR